jgi:hypothetical protein
MLRTAAGKNGQNLVVYLILTYILWSITSIPISYSFKRSQFLAPQKLGHNAKNPAVVWQSGSALKESSIIVDSISYSALTILGDVIAQLIEKKDFDYERSKRFGILGIADGFIAHGWYYSLESYISGTDAISVMERIAADSLLYGPVWCAWFIFAMSLLEGKNVSSVPSLWKERWADLVVVSTKCYFPCTVFIYSVVPLEYRTVSAAGAMILFTVAISLWNNFTNGPDAGALPKPVQINDSVEIISLEDLTAV